LLEFSEAIKPPRTTLLNFPLGCPAGKPNDPLTQRRILEAVFHRAPSHQGGAGWRIDRLPLDWPDGGRAVWEPRLREAYAGGAHIVAAHSADHRKRGEVLVGNERQFAIRCNC